MRHGVAAAEAQELRHYLSLGSDITFSQRPRISHAQVLLDPLVQQARSSLGFRKQGLVIGMPFHELADLDGQMIPLFQHSVENDVGELKAQWQFLLRPYRRTL